MTKAQLRDAIKQEARIKTGTNLDTLVDAVVTDILRDYCNKARYYELLVLDLPVTLVAATTAYNLPADFQNLGTVRYGIGPTPTVFRTLKPITELIYRTVSTGVPFFYLLSAGPQIQVFPYADLTATDQLLISYYRDPNSLYTLETSPFPVPRIEGAVKKDALARIARFHSDNQEAQMDSADAQSSFISAQSADI